MNIYAVTNVTPYFVITQALKNPHAIKLMLNNFLGYGAWNDNH